MWIMGPCKFGNENQTDTSYNMDRNAGHADCKPYVPSTKLSLVSRLLAKTVETNGKFSCEDQCPVQVIRGDDRSLV